MGLKREGLAMGVLRTKDGLLGKSKIMLSAAELFSKKGLDGVGIREIALHSGYNLSLISYYFGGKEGLYKAIFGEYSAKILDELKEGQLRIAEGELSKDIYLKEMQRVLAAFAGIRVRYPYFFTLLQRELLSDSPVARDIYETVLASFERNLSHYIALAQQAGIVRVDLDPKILFQSMLHVIECSRHFSKSDMYLDQIYKIFIEGTSVRNTA